MILPDQYDGFPLTALRTVVRETVERPKGRKGSCITRMQSPAYTLHLLEELQGYYKSLEADAAWRPAMNYSSKVLPASIIVYSKSPAWWVYEANPHKSPIRDSILASYRDAIIPDTAPLEDPTMRPIDSTAWEVARSYLEQAPNAGLRDLVTVLNARGIDGMRETIHLERVGLIKFEGTIVQIAEGC